ncbi:MAG: zinc-dependent alcohol dehydrogenase family protein [Chitinophagales bacterium]|nr:zinc-dependent alcohol dehydrogenase family protein [Chitinophagales bacterium]
MKAAIYKEFKGPITIGQVPDPKPKDHDAIIKVKASGLCLSDWHGWMGHDKDIVLPHVPGHELAGEIVEVGKSVKNWKAGQRVTVPFVCACGSCEVCAENNQQVCPNQTQPGFTHWGSFAEYVRIDHADTNLVALPESIDHKTAASLGCRFATSFRAVVDQGKVREGQWVSVFGCGGVGMSAIMIAKAMGARVIAIDIDESKLEFARKELGADAVINISKEDKQIQKILDITNGGSHISIDALGKPEIVWDGINSLRRRGKHIQVGILQPEVKNAPIPMDRMISHEIEVIGSHGMQAFRYEEMLSLIINGKLDPARLISEEITLEQVCEELSVMDRFESSGIRVCLM